MYGQGNLKPRILGHPLLQADKPDGLLKYKPHLRRHLILCIEDDLRVSLLIQAWVPMENVSINSSRVFHIENSIIPAELYFVS